MKQQIAQEIKKVLETLGIKDINPAVDYPADAKHGDYSSNVAMIVAKKLSKNPREFAEELRIKLQNLDIVEKVEIAGPGFINFWVKDEYFIDVIANEMKQSPSNSESSGGLPRRFTPRNDGVFNGKKIIVEYTDPNPFKELHIGHLYSNIIGESLCRLFEATGATVKRVDYYGDVGMHVAKSLWGLKEKFKVKSSKFKVIEDLETVVLEERIAFLGEGYALGSNAYAENLEAAEAIKHLNKLIYIIAQREWDKEKGLQPQVNYAKEADIDEQELAEISKLYLTGRKWSLENFERAYKRLGTMFDGYYPESIAGERGYKLVRDNIENGIFVESEGAVIFPGEKYGLHNRVFINKLGLPTYEAKELGLAPWKYEEFPYDLSFIVTASEIAGYFSVLVEALRKVNPELGAKTTPLLHGMVKLPEGKMSSRSGNVITVNALLDEAKERVLPRVAEDVEGRKVTAEMIGIAAVKYAFLKSSIGKDIVFDFDESVSFEGNSGPYLLYTYARTQSVLAKSHNVSASEAKPSTGLYLAKQSPSSSEPSGRLPRPLHGLAMTGGLVPEERQLLRLLVRFDEIVEEAVVRYSPNVVATYLFELAQAFNLFYQKHPILKGVKDKLPFRLALTKATGKTLKNGLHLLGIQAPERM